MALVSAFELLHRSQLQSPLAPSPKKVTCKVIQGYCLSITNVNFFPVTVSLVFTVTFPFESTDPTKKPAFWENFLRIVDFSGHNLSAETASQATLVPEVIPQNNKARITFTLPENGTSLVLLKPSTPDSLQITNFEACGYVELFLSSPANSDTATLLLTPEHRGTFCKNVEGESSESDLADPIAYALPIANGGVFRLSNCQERRS